MIHEAIDTAFAIWDALVVFAFVGVVVVLAGLVCGTWAVKRAWRAIRKPHLPPPENLPIPAPIAALRRPNPSWVLPPDPEPQNVSLSPRHEKEHIA